MSASTPHKTGAILADVSETVDDVRLRVQSYRSRQDAVSVGLVPTMGFFHEGHLSLMRAARRECGFVVTSIFVNPAQFGPDEDYDTYPRDLDHDISLALQEGVDLVLAPSVEEVYAGGAYTAVEVGATASGLCGASRPGHFRGVATVVAKLFNIVAPDIAYFGQKDAQQAAVIRQMARDLNFNVAVRVCPTVRESDGLAMSSRNVNLSAAERAEAAALYEGLKKARAAVASGAVSDAAGIKKIINDTIASRSLVELEYIEVVDPDTMQPMQNAELGTMAAVAAHVGRTRIIDNVVLLPREG